MGCSFLSLIAWFFAFRCYFLGLCMYMVYWGLFAMFVLVVLLGLFCGVCVAFWLCLVCLCNVTLILLLIGSCCLRLQ